MGEVDGQIQLLCHLECTGSNSLPSAEPSAEKRVARRGLEVGLGP